MAAAAATTTAADRFEPLDLRQVKVGGEIGRRIEVTITNNLLVLDADRDFLAPFGAKDRDGGYIGLGKLIDATARLAAYSRDPRVLALKKHLVERTLASQEVDGYAGMLAPEHRVTRLWDVHEMAYLLWGLLTDYECFENDAALEGARRLGDYLVAHWNRFPADRPDQTDVATHVAVTGVERAMLALYRRTGDPRHLDFVVRTRALPDWDLGIVIGRRPLIEGHIYAYLCRCLALLELHRLRPATTPLRQPERALDFLTWNDGLLITGAAGQCEIWTNDQDGRGDLGETCATAYQLRLYDAFLRLRGEAPFGDLIERTVWNTLFAAQSPDGRRLRYFSPVEGARVYFDGDTYCCPCNYRRIIAELPQMVFYRTDDGVAVNLFAPAEGQLELPGGRVLRLRQETAYPNDGRIELRLEPEQPERFGVQLRIPAWAGGATVQINGKAEPAPATPGTFLTLERTWQAGDRITLELPMRWRLVEGRQRQAGRVAVMRGPLVFCLDPTQNPELAGLDAAELGYLALDPASLGEPEPDDSVRPGGLACRAGFWKAGFSLNRQHAFKLRLTEFPNPSGTATYFRLRDYAAAQKDELLDPATWTGRTRKDTP